MSSNIRVIRGAVGAVGFAAALALAATPALVWEVDLGLWEVTTKGQMSGPPPIPESELAKLPPQQRAALEASFARGVQPHARKECMTAEKRAHGFRSDRPRAGCKVTVVTNTATEYEMRTECTDERGTGSESAHFKLDGRRHATGTVDIVLSAEGQTSRMHHSVEAKWVSADCGDVK